MRTFLWTAIFAVALPATSAAQADQAGNTTTPAVQTQTTATMGFLGNWGFKADVRYLRAAGQYSISTSGPTPTPGTPAPFPYSTMNATAAAAASAAIDDPRATAFANNVLSGLAFWRANFGVAFRW